MFDLFNFLPMFEADGGNAGGGEATNQGGGSPDQHANDGGQQSEGQENQNQNEKEKNDENSLSFSKEAFNERMERERKKASKETQEAFLKDLGINDVEAIKDIIKKQKEQEEASKSELQKAQEARVAAEKKAEEALSQSNQRLLQAETKLTAAELGVKPERVDYLVKLADLDGTVKDGEIDREAVKASLEAVLNDFPELKGQTGAPSAGSDFDSGTQKDLLTMEALQNMSQDEIYKRWDEVEKLLNKK